MLDTVKTTKLVLDKNERIAELEEENRKLKEAVEIADMCVNNTTKENKKLKEDRDFFKEQAILWRKDYTNEYEKNRELREELEKEDKAKMNALNSMSDLSKFGLEQIKKLEEEKRKLEDDVNYWHHRAMKAERGEE